jgi:CSLREA domain-containing protein
MQRFITRLSLRDTQHSAGHYRIDLINHRRLLTMPAHRFISSAFVLAALVLLLALFAPPAHAATIVVNKLADTAPGPCARSGNGSCTLREAILYANTAAGTNTITFKVTGKGTGTITLNSPLPPVNRNLTINGSQKITVDGASKVNVLTVNGGTVTLENFTIANGKCSGFGAAGGITNFSTLTILNMTFSGNDGYHGSCVGAIQNSGALTVRNSLFSQNLGFYGAGIYNDGSDSNNATLNVTNSKFTGNLYGTGTGIYNGLFGKATISTSAFSGNSTSDGAFGGAIENYGALTVDTTDISENSAHDGGGIYNGGTLNLTNSLVSGNSAGLNGAALYNDGSASPATLNVTNTTITQNSASYLSGGIHNYTGGTLNVTNSTIWGNTTQDFPHHSGGIYNEGTSVTLRNTIVADNHGSQCYDSTNTLHADTHNIDDDGTCDQATQRAVTAIALDTLKDNGGATKTLALLTGSVAIDTGDDNVCAGQVGSPNYGAGGKDQRGVLRPQLYHCDVGAYEFNAEDARGFVVNSSADTSDGSCDPLGHGTGNQDCTLREAVEAANTDKTPDVITFNIPETDTGCVAANDCTITLTKPLADVTSSLLIDGAPNNGHITVAAASGSSILTVQKTTTFQLNLNALTLVNGINNPPNDQQPTGAHTIINNGTLNVTNSTFLPSPTFSDSTSFAIKDYGTTTVTNSTFVGKTGGIFPQFGGIDKFAGTVSIVNSTIATDFVGIMMEASATTATLRNSIIVSTLAVPCDTTFAPGTLTADEFNLASGAGCDNATQTTLGALALGPLQDNGGPTPTFNPGASSVALNAADNSICNSGIGAPNFGAGGLDQRGVPRPQGSSCDVGAVEREVNP